jgi:hypothetical protein
MVARELVADIVVNIVVDIVAHMMVEWIWVTCNLSIKIRELHYQRSLHTTTPIFAYQPHMTLQELVTFWLHFIFEYSQG